MRPTEHLKYDVIHEFYANAIPSDKETFSLTTMFKGRMIHFNKEAIIHYYGNLISLG